VKCATTGLAPLAIVCFIAVDGRMSTEAHTGHSKVHPEAVPEVRGPARRRAFFGISGGLPGLSTG
jgi:hypothetical protein